MNVSYPQHQRCSCRPFRGCPWYPIYPDLPVWANSFRASGAWPIHSTSQESTEQLGNGRLALTKTPVTDSSLRDERLIPSAYGFVNHGGCALLGTFYAKRLHS